MYKMAKIAYNLNSMTEKETILKVHELGVKLENHQILNNLSFFVKKGDVLALVGPNGAGKSVLFRTLLGLVPYSGEVEWQENLKINYIPQKFYIDKDTPLTVEEFLKFKNKDINHVISTLISVGITDDAHPGEVEHFVKEHLLQHRIGWLSGGQLQRVLIAWSILDNPDVLLFDEPTSGIDIGGEETIYNLLETLRQERNLTILLISHDLNIVYKYANNVICLNREMTCFGAPKIVLDPRALTELYGGETSFYRHEHKSGQGHDQESITNNYHD
jgi:zinc transport system ATP-binding protein